MYLDEIVADQNSWWRTEGSAPREATKRRRTVVEELLRRLYAVGDRRAVLVRGARQVGKTTVLKQIASDLLEKGWDPRAVLYFDFSDDRLVDEVSPRQVLSIAAANAAESELPMVALLDEIGSARRWSAWLKQAVDDGVARIVATDSAATLLKKGTAESGQGRWDEVLMEGLLYSEFRNLTSVEEPEPAALERYLLRGGFPEHVDAQSNTTVRERLRADIVDRAILRDLTGVIDDPRGAGRLFVYLVQESGGLLEAANRATDLGVHRQTVTRWSELLIDACLIQALPRRRLKPSARLRSHLKLYAADHGMVTAYAPSPSSDDELRGKVFETVVFRHLRDLARARGAELTFYRRDREGGPEIDFVLEGEEPVAIEVTKGLAARSKKVKKLKAAMDNAGVSRGVLVHGGVDKTRFEEIGAWPLGLFLLNADEILVS